MVESRELPEIYQSLFNMTFWWPLTMMNTSYFQEKKKISSLLASVALFSLASPHTFLSNPSKSALLSFYSLKIHWYNICCIPKKLNLFKGRLFLLPKSLPFLTPS